MKTTIAFVFLSVFVTYASATPENSFGLENRVQLGLGDIVKEILECLMNNLSALSKEDLSFILQKLKELLQRLGGCLNININDATENDILALIQCLIEKLSQASSEELKDIVNQLNPVLVKVQNILECIKNVLKKVCAGLCNIPGIELCGSPVLGIDLLKIILQILNPLLNLLLCKLVG